MANNQRHHPATCKFRIPLEAPEGSKTISQLSSEHDIHPNQIRPKISNTPQAAQFTTNAFTASLPPPNIQINIDTPTHPDAPHISPSPGPNIGPHPSIQFSTSSAPKNMPNNNKEPHKLNFRDIITYIIGFSYFLFVFYMLTLNWHG